MGLIGHLQHCNCSCCIHAETTYWKKTPKAYVSDALNSYIKKDLAECQRLCRAEKDCRSIAWSTNKNCFLSKSAKLSPKQPSFNHYELVVVDGTYVYVLMC